MKVRRISAFQHKRRARREARRAEEEGCETDMECWAWGPGLPSRGEAIIFSAMIVALLLLSVWLFYFLVHVYQNKPDIALSKRHIEMPPQERTLEGEEYIPSKQHSSPDVPLYMMPLPRARF